ncbi:tautomerase family protein [Variovorax sp. Root411]|uniref:tautomerase family protein n=1 Tax=Variovorax sp. Root411 TaxID=1736530 RepID=UPI000B1D7668|nr:tautomerase family protein [Variovorax sp. Root411]
MPVIVCECKAGIPAGVKAKMAAEFTSAIREIILSPLDLISVVFHEATPENTYRSGEATSESCLWPKG